MINPELMELLESNDVLDVLQDSVSYQIEKLENIEKTTEGQDWYRSLPQITKEKINNYKTDYLYLSHILKSSHEEIVSEMKKGYYFWRLLKSACITYQNDLIEYDQQLLDEFALKPTNAISNNSVLGKCIGIFEKHVIENDN
ncbi:MAG: hypothetical protein R3327_05910 [Nitrosopumilaceae archaeon]|nr:hypothetical protein [Nitrosopumilaceae archaeon]